MHGRLFILKTTSRKKLIPICVRRTYDSNDPLKAENRNHLEGRVQITNIIADHIDTSLGHINLIYDIEPRLIRI